MVLKNQRKKILGLTCGGGQRGPILLKGYDMPCHNGFSKSDYKEIRWFAKGRLKINTVQGDMTNHFQFENETFDIIFNPVSNVYIEDLENMYKETSQY